MFLTRRRSSLLLLLASPFLLLAACGGGGGGSSKGSSSSGGSAGTTSSGSPAPPAITYSGTQAPANFSDQNAAVLVDGMFAMTFLALDLANDIGSPASSPGPFNSTQKGPQGGSVTINGVLNQDGMTGWVQGDFVDYQQNGITYNGREVIEITQGLSSGHAQLGRISYYGLNAVGANLDVSYTGTIDRSIPSGDPSAVWTVTGSVLIQDLIGQSEWYAKNIDIIRTPVSGGMQLNVNSRVYESQIGYVDVTTPTPWVFVDNVPTPDHGGPLLGTGEDGRTLALSSLTPLLGAITYESAGASQPDRSARITWLSPASRQVGTQGLRGKAEPSGSTPLPPIADSGAATTIAPGTTRVLDGRFSYQPSGDFLGFNWRLRSKPPGSTAALDDPSAVQPTLTFDLPGNYLIELTASDGSVQTTDAMSIAVNQNITHLSTTAQLAPDTRASVGETLSFTVQRPSSFLSDPAISLYLQCQAPDGTMCFVDIDSSNNYTFTPTETGVYSLVLTDLADQGPLDTQWLAVGGDFRWLPTASVPRAFPSPEFVFTAQGDLNGDGFKDLVVSANDYSLNPTLEIYHGNAAGGFDAPVIVNDGIGGPVAIGDFNGDGRLDLAVTTSNGFDLLLQQTDGTLASPQSYSIQGCYLPQDGAYLGAADFNGDGRTDLIVGGFCKQLVLFTQGADGVMHQGPSVAIPGGGAGQFAVGDLNADGLADLVIAMNSYTPNIMIIPGDRTNGLGTAYTLPESFLPVAQGLPALAVGDINGDGRDDLLFSVDDNLGNRGIHVYLQQPNGTLQAAAPLSTRGITNRIIIADINGDGLVDVGVAGGDGPGLSIRYQTASGTLQPPLVDNRAQLQPLTVMDVDRDGILDLVGIGGSQLSNVNTSSLAIGYGVAPGSENVVAQSASQARPQAHVKIERRRTARQNPLVSPMR